MVWFFIESLLTLPLLYAIIATIIEFRFDKKHNIEIICAAIIATVLADACLLFSGMDIDTLYSRAWLTTCVPSFLCLFYLAKYRDGRFLFAFLTECVVGSITTLLSTLIIFLLPWNLEIFRVILHVGMLFAIYNVARRIFKEKLFEAIRAQQNKQWLLYCILPALCLTFWMMFMNSPSRSFDIVHKVNIPYTGYIYLNDIPDLIVLLISVFYTLSLILIIIASTYKTYMERRENSALDFEIKSLQNLISRMEEKDETLRILRHDMRHHLITISALLENKDGIETAQNYLHQLDSNLMKTKQDSYCNNSVINAILSSYAEKTQRNNIEFTAVVQIPNELSVNDMDIGAVISNALENAYNACLMLPIEEQRFIKLKFIRSKKQVVIDISNSYNGKVEMDSSGTPISNRKNHGFGTQSILAFARKYNSSVDYAADGGVFSVRMMFVDSVKKV